MLKHILNGLHLDGRAAVAILVGAVLLAIVTSLRRQQPPEAEQAPRKRGGVWAAFLAVGAVAAAFVFAHSKSAPPAPPAAAPKPAPVHTEVIKQITTRVASHSPLNGIEITIIAIVLAGTCVAIWVNRTRSA